MLKIDRLLAQLRQLARAAQAASWVFYAASIAAILTLSGCAQSAKNQTGSASNTGNPGGSAGAPSFSLSPSSLNFASQPSNTTSAPQTVTLSNSGTAPLTISSMSITGANSSNFSQTNNCPLSPATLPGGAGCSVKVVFTPSATGTEQAALTVSDHADSNSQSVSLTGIGTNSSTGVPNLTVSPSGLNFASQPPNTTSAPQTVTLSNSGTAPLTINSVSITGANSSNFSETNNCPVSPATFPGGASCLIKVTFTPSAAGIDQAALSVSDTAAGSPQTLLVTGTGSGAGTPSSTAQFPIALTVQEAIYPGVSGVDRAQDPVTVGVPLADEAGITDISTLGLSGAPVGQFRILGRWPSGNVKWLQVDTQADETAGGQNVAIALTNSGSGNFGGGNLATDNGPTVTISTGAATFVVKKANFDLLDSAIVGGKNLVSTSSTGLTLIGPPPGSTTCPCSTVYTSSNDMNSTASIEENGPVRVSLKATGQLKDSSGHAYMRFTVRLHFFYNKSYVKADTLLQNADYGTSNTFATAYKGFGSFEARLTPSLGSQRSYSFGTSNTPVMGSFSGTENAYLYQAYTNYLEDCFFAGGNDLRYDPRSPIARTGTASNSCTDTWTYAQNGYQVVDGSTLLASGTSSQPPTGWADLSDSTGAGIEVGIYQMAAYWPKSLQFMNGGSEVRIGIWPDQTLYRTGGGQQYFQSWPFYSEHTIYFNFHSATITPDVDFARFNYPLIARAPITAYNSANVFPYPILPGTAVDNFYKTLGTGCCITDISPKVYRGYDWPAGGAGNQDEARWANLLLWLQRGYPGRYLDAKHFYTFQTEQVFARSDYNGTTPFHWRDSFVPSAALDESGEPNIISSLNNNIGCDSGATSCGANHMEPVDQHAHWYGMIDYYFITGDESVKDAIEDGPTDSFGNPNVRQVVNSSYVTRAVGIALMSQARLYGFYTAIGDTAEANTVLGTADTVFNGEPAAPLQVSGYGTSENGTSFTRGVNWCCGGSPRDGKPFETGILNMGIWEYLQAHGRSWSGYNRVFDVAEGISSWAMNEAFINTGTPDTSCATGAALTYQIDIDNPNSLTAGCGQTVWSNFFTAAKYNDIGLNLPWASDFKAHLKHVDAHSNPGQWAEYGTFIVEIVINEILNPEPYQLVDVPVTATNQGGGSVLSWTVPAGVQSYRIKHAPNPIVHWVGFNPTTNTFIGNPSSTVPWFAATDVDNPPTPAAPGTTQSFTVTGLGSSENFAMKAYVKSGP